MPEDQAPSRGTGKLMAGLIIGLLLGGGSGAYLGWMVGLNAGAAAVQSSVLPEISQDTLTGGQAASAQTSSQNPLDFVQTNPYENVKVNPFE